MSTDQAFRLAVDDDSFRKPPQGASNEWINTNRSRKKLRI